MKKIKTTLFKLLLFTITHTISQFVIADISGVLDVSFNPNGAIPGVVRTKVSEGRDLAQAIAVQRDNKIIAAGLAFNGLIDNVALVRYNHDGSLDLSFGNNGIVTTEIANGNSYAYDVTLDQDQRIIIVGSGQSEKGNYEFIVVRYNQNGSLDSSFGNNGIVLTDFDERFDQANKVIVQSNGKIVVAGLARPAEGNPAVALSRYNTDGSLDSTFGQNGKVLTVLDDNTHQALGLGLQEDGKIVISGFRLAKKSESRIILIRYNIDGSLDQTFGENGVVETQFEPLSFGTSLVIQPDGKIAIAANIITSGFNHAVPAIVRYNSDGSLDTTFGNNGLALVDIGKRTEIYDIVRNSNGNLIIGGFVIEERTGIQPEPSTDALIISFNSDGNLNTNFNPNGPMPGITVASLGPDITSRSFSMVLDQNEKIVVAGGTSEELNRSQSDFLVARFIDNSSITNQGKMSLIVKIIREKYCNN